MTYAIIGLGRFGSYVAKGLIEQHSSVIVVDTNESALKEFKLITEDALIIDTTDSQALQEAGVSSADVAIVSIGENIEGSILTVMALKEVGIKMIIAKAYNEIHGKILSKIGVNRVIYPERDAAKKLVSEFIINPKFVVIDVTTSMKIVKIVITPELSGYKISDLILKYTDLIKPISLKRGEEWVWLPPYESVLGVGDTILIMGESTQITSFIANCLN